MGRRLVFRSARCHPERNDFARGLCCGCYTRERRTLNYEREKELDREYWRRNRDRLCALRKKRLDADPTMREKMRAWGREHNRRYPERVRDRQLRRAYGISLEVYRQMLAEQDGRCALCQSSEPGGKGTFCVDHDHGSGVVRSLLCHFCNVALAYLRDRPDLAEAAAAYLRKHGQS